MVGELNIYCRERLVSDGDLTFGEMNLEPLHAIYFSPLPIYQRKRPKDDGENKHKPVW